MQDDVLKMLHRVPANIVGDARPVMSIDDALTRAQESWRRRFEANAARLARWFTQGQEDRSAAYWKKVAGDFGIPTVNPSFSSRIQRLLQNTADENVALIKSIPEEYFARIRKEVYSAVAKDGLNIQKVYDAVLSTGEVTKHRAQFIAEDQNFKASSELALQRSLDAGITQGAWQHSVRWKTEPRWSHYHAGLEGKLFDLTKGCLLWEGTYNKAKQPLTGQYIYVKPSMLPRCKCTYRPVLLVNGL